MNSCFRINWIKRVSKKSLYLPDLFSLTGRKRAKVCENKCGEEGQESGYV